MTTKKPAAPCSCPRRKGWEHLPSCHEAAPQSSPLPWVVDPHGIGTRWNIHDANGEPIAITNQTKADMSTYEGRNSQPIRDLNTALIVRRVNQGPAFDAMVEALEQAAKMYEQVKSNGHPVTGLTHYMDRINSARKLAQEVR